jgi:hypothetical protein
MSESWVIDAGMGWPPCCCPIEGDLDGDCTIIRDSTYFVPVNSISITAPIREPKPQKAKRKKVRTEAQKIARKARDQARREQQAA